MPDIRKLPLRPYGMVGSLGYLPDPGTSGYGRHRPTSPEISVLSNQQTMCYTSSLFDTLAFTVPNLEGNPLGVPSGKVYIRRVAYSGSRHYRVALPLCPAWQSSDERWRLVWQSGLDDQSLQIPSGGFGDMPENGVPTTNAWVLALFSGSRVTSWWLGPISESTTLVPPLIPSKTENIPVQVFEHLYASGDPDVSPLFNVTLTLR